MTAQVSIPDSNDNIYFPDLPLHPPTAEEIRQVVKKLKNHKAVGTDQLSNEQLKFGDEAIVEKMLPIFEKVSNH